MLKLVFAEITCGACVHCVARIFIFTDDQSAAKTKFTA